MLKNSENGALKMSETKVEPITRGIKQTYFALSYKIGCTLVCLHTLTICYTHTRS